MDTYPRPWRIVKSEDKKVVAVVDADDQQVLFLRDSASNKVSVQTLTHIVQCVNRVNWEDRIDSACYSNKQKC